MDRRILDMECTLWKKGPETNRKATWTRISFPCHWEPQHGTYRTANGEESAWNCAIIATYDGFSKGDKVALGVSTSDTPPADAYTVVLIDMLPLRGRVHHYEVMAE